MNIDDIILKCQTGEEHLDQAEYEQVARWLEEYKTLKAKKEFCMGHVDVTVTDSDKFKEVVKAFDFACWVLSKSSGCFDGYCPLEKVNCPDCGDENLWQEYFLQKAREQE